MENNENIVETPQRKPLTPKAKKIITVVSVVAVLLIFILAIVIPYAVIMGNNLYVDNVDKIAIGATQSDVTDVLGDPDEKDGDIWKWGDGSKYCSITFEDGLVKSLVLDAATKTTNKKVAGTRFPGAENFRATDTTANLTYKIKYMDGSMIKGVAQAELRIVEKEGESVADKDSYRQMAKWTGAFGEVDVDINKFEYDLVKDGNTPTGVRITNYVGVNTEVAIPTTIAGLPVVGIADDAMRELDITKLFIPASLTKVERWIVEKCENLTVYCEAPSKPSEWSDLWNISKVPVVWNCKLQYDENGNMTPVVKE